MQARLDAFHQRVRSSLAPARSTKRGAVSVHEVGNKVTLSDVNTFLKIANAERLGQSALLGSLKDDIVLSVNADLAPKPASGKKRKSDDAADDATRVVDRVRRGSADSSESAAVSTASFRIARDGLTKLLEVRSVAGERAVECYYVGRRKPGANS